MKDKTTPGSLVRIRRCKSGLIVLLIGTFFFLQPIFTKAQTVRVNSGDPVRFGMGYNTLTGTYAGNCTVDVQPGDIHPAGADFPSPGQLTTWEMTSVDDLLTLAQKLDLSASASASFFAGSASASTQFVSSRLFSSYHQFVYLSTTVANDTLVWTKPALTKENQHLYATNPFAFLTKCGDTFVRTVTSGGELTAIVNISTLAEQNSSSLSINISGNYGTVEGKAALRTSLEQYLLHRQASVKVMRAGGTGTLPSYSVEDLITATLSFGEVAAQNPYPTIAGLADYGTVVSTPSVLTGEQQIFIRPIFRAYVRAMQYSGDLDYVRLNTPEFRIMDFSKSKLKDPEKDFDLFRQHRQLVLGSGDFSFADVDKDKVNNAITVFQKYEDDLTALAYPCFLHPGTDCKGKIPNEPPRLKNLVRVFTHQENWDAKAGPVDIVLSNDWVCKVDTIIGHWNYGGGDLPCDRLPKSVINGHIVQGDFDASGAYYDNSGSCTYQFMCTRR
ncbi:MAG: hypothetical protein JWN45_782 [Acidobacteriaceae bacterium]|nr:hypothetical protein [Acidobacteriaceae bacterium]